MSIPGLAHFAQAPFEYDFRKLRAELSTSQQTQEFNQNQDDLFGRWPQPTIVLADEIEEVEPIRAAIRKQDKDVPGDDVIGEIATIYDLLPGTPEQQRHKLDLIASIKKLLKDPALEVLTPKERKQFDAVNPPEDLRILQPADLPPTARRLFTEADGTVGRVVLVYPGAVSIWRGLDLLRIAKVLQNIHLEKEGKTIETSGSAVVFGAMIRSIVHDGPIATTASLLLVMVVTLLAMRPLKAALGTIATLLAGVIWMLGAAGAAGVRITFLNFIALPITFGIGAEYALNKQFFLRGGYVASNQEEYLFGPSLGAGVAFNVGDSRWNFDYAWSSSEFFDDNQYFTFMVGF